MKRCCGGALSKMIDDFFHWELVDVLGHHAVEVENLAASLTQVVFFYVVYDLVELGIVAVFGEEELLHAAGRGQRLEHLLVITARQNWNAWSVLGDVTRKHSVLGHDNDQVNAEVLACFYRLRGETFSRSDLVGRELLDVEEGGLVVNAALGLGANLAQEVDSVSRVITV